jgi:hypothetical protein
MTTPDKSNAERCGTVNERIILSKCNREVGHDGRHRETWFGPTMDAMDDGERWIEWTDHPAEPSTVEVGERITHVAIRKMEYGGYYSLAVPGSHYALSRKITEILPDERPLRSTQGFVATSPAGRPRFVDRAEAKRIAIAAGQYVNPISDSDDLFSEELWTPEPSTVTDKHGIPVTTTGTISESDQEWIKKHNEEAEKEESK